MKKQIMITLLVLLVCKITSFACMSGPDYIYYNQAFPKKQIILGRLNAAGPLLAFNSKGEVITGFDKIRGAEYRDYSFEEQDGILKRQDGNKFQFFDARNQFAPIGESYVSATLFSEGLAIVSKKNERLKIIDDKGNTVAIIVDYDGKTIELARQFSGGFAAVKTEDNLWGFIDKKGNMVITPQFNDVSNFNESYCVVEVRKEKKAYVGIIDTKGAFAFPLTTAIKLADKVSNGVIGFKKTKEAFGVMDVFGKEVLAPNDKINWIGEFNKNNMAPFSNGSAFGILSNTGKIIAKSRYEMLYLLDDYYMVQNPNTKLVELIDYKGKLLKVLPYTSLTPFGNSGYLASQNSEDFLINNKFEEIMEQPIIYLSYYGNFSNRNLPIARTDFFDIKKILASPIFGLTKNGVAGLKSGDNVAKMIEVLNLDEDKRMSLKYDAEDVEIILTSEDRAYGEHIYTCFYGDLYLKAAIPDEENDDDEEDEDEEIAIAIYGASDQGKMYRDTLDYLSDKKMQEITIRNPQKSPVSFKYGFIFNDFVKTNQFEDKQNTCNICRLIGTSINTKATLTGFELKLSLQGKASGKASLLFDELIIELKKLGLDVQKTGNIAEIINPQQKSKKVGNIELKGGSEIFLVFNF